MEPDYLSGSALGEFPPLQQSERLAEDRRDENERLVTERREK